MRLNNSPRMTGNEEEFVVGFGQVLLVFFSSHCWMPMRMKKPPPLEVFQICRFRALTCELYVRPLDYFRSYSKAGYYTSDTKLTVILAIEPGDPTAKTAQRNLLYTWAGVNQCL